ncbi:MT-A70 family methyltransferase [Sphingomonas sp.]|uniref:MT-A70 family methyltransferase n=1 Tax=Sphingomonas sp. TaxID=28214 RepID=UPI00307EC8D7
MQAMTDWPFGDLRMFGYRIILADPPWTFDAGGDRQARKHYDVMSTAAIQALPVGHLAAPNCGLIMWALDPMLDVAIDTGRAWGFRFVTVHRYWAKTLRSGKPGWHMGTGYGTRANPEIALLFMNGSLGLPKDRGVRRLLTSPIREHSRKPEEIHTDIERMYDGPYVELFARERRPGWDAWGNQLDRF